MPIKHVATYLLCIVISFALVSCGLNPILYPDNDLAATGGVLHARVNPDGSTLIVLPTMETLTGRFSELSGPTTAFGTLLGETSAGVAGMRAPGTRFGVITLLGDKGTRMNCEWYAGSAGQGAGICVTNHNSRYRIMW